MAGLCEDRIDAALRDAVDDVVYESDGRWMFYFTLAGKPGRLHASGDWLRVSTDLPIWAGTSAAGIDRVECLRTNASLGAGVRVALPGRTAVPRLIADANLHGGSSLEARVKSICLEVESALPLVGPPIDASENSVKREEIQRACCSAGWTESPGEGARIRLGVDRRLAPLAATVQSLQDGTFRATVPLADLTDWSAACRQAASVLLLRACWTLRSVTGALCQRDNVAEVATLIAPLEEPFDSGVDRALSSLAVACRMSGQEVLALRDEQLARRYLEAFGGSAQHNSHTTMEEATCLQQP